MHPPHRPGVADVPAADRAHADHGVRAVPPQRGLPQDGAAAHGEAEGHDGVRAVGPGGGDRRVDVAQLGVAADARAAAGAAVTAEVQRPDLAERGQPAGQPPERRAARRSW